MKFLRFLPVFFFVLLIKLAFGQKVTVSPIPQSITWGQKAFSNKTAFSIQGASIADADAVTLLKQSVKISSKGIPIIIGKKGDRLVRNFAAQIPNKKEGYFLKIEPKRVVIAGFDSVGTYYGVQTFLQLMASPNVMQTTVKDFPDVPERGVVEGFYGNPFSHEDRLRQFDFYGRNKMNVYIYGPKDDPYHGFGTKWRDPYPEKDAARIKELIDAAHQNKVQFVWAVHPGNDIHWNYADSIATIKKFEAMYELGVRTFAVFFDDIGGIGTNPVKQAGYMNFLHDEFVAKKPDVGPLIFCPTQYNQAWSGGDYLEILGKSLNPETKILWTGKSVVAMIDKATMDWINPRIKRNAYIWYNYPVNDYVVDRMLMGPTYGNSNDIADQLSGFVSNPMEYAEASKVSLYSIADYLWNMKQYNPQSSWNRAIKYLMPKNAAAFKVFAENNIDLGPTGHRLRRENESPRFRPLAETFLKDYDKGIYNAAVAGNMIKEFNRIKTASIQLQKSTENIPLREEIKPWLQVLSVMSDKGNAVMRMAAALDRKDSVNFIRQYKIADSMEQLQKKIFSRDFEGSIKSPNPKPAHDVIAPFTRQLQSTLIAAYKKQYSYQTDVFPKQLLEDKKYLIKVNGKYLSNNMAVTEKGGNPVLVAHRDSINPQRQEWFITMDVATDRYKIMNAQDSRYVNELGNFGVNPYSASWNTYLLENKDGKFSIQNAENGGKQYWIITDDRIRLGRSSKPGDENFVFEIVELDVR